MTKYSRVALLSSIGDVAVRVFPTGTEASLAGVGYLAVQVGRCSLVPGDSLVAIIALYQTWRAILPGALLQILSGLTTLKAETGSMGDEQGIYIQREPRK